MGQCCKMVGLRLLLLVGIMQHMNLIYHLSTVARWFAFVIG